MQKMNIFLAYIPCSHGLIDFRFSGHFGWAGTRTDKETRQGYAASLQKFVEVRFLLQSEGWLYCIPNCSIRSVRNTAL